MENNTKNNIKKNILFGLMMSVLMALSMSSIMLIVNFGFFEGFWKVWGELLLHRSLPVSIISMTILAPFFKKFKGMKGRFMSGTFLCTIMSFFSTATRFGIHDSEFFWLWGRAFCLGMIIATPLAIFYSIMCQKIIAKIFKE